MEEVREEFDSHRQLLRQILEPAGRSIEFIVKGSVRQPKRVATKSTVVTDPKHGKYVQIQHPPIPCHCCFVPLQSLVYAFVMEPPIYYSKAEFIETVRNCHNGPDRISVLAAIFPLGHRKQGFASRHYRWPAEHHPWWQDHHI